MVHPISFRHIGCRQAKEQKQRMSGQSSRSNLKGDKYSTNNSELIKYYRSLQSDNDTTSIAILKDIWNDHASKMDSEGVDIFSSSITKLISNTDMVCRTKYWKSNLNPLPDDIATNCLQCNNKACYDNKHLNVDDFDVFKNNSYIVNIDIHHNTNPQTCKEQRTQNSHFKQPSLQMTSRNQNSIVQTLPTAVPSPRNVLTDFNSQKSLAVENRYQDSNNDNKVKSVFKTARDQLLATNPAAKRSLGTARKATNRFISPMMSEKVEEAEETVITDDRLKNIDPKMVELIQNEIIDNGTPVEWNDIAGLETAKTVIQEAVVWPLLRPDIFTGLRRPPKGVLLFGPPGTGKTLIGKCVASQCRATFFNISASSLTSKWIGDGEKMVRALFAVARTCQPAVVFVDEIDSLLTQRSDAEHEATRRIKTEFLVQFDGAGTGDEDRILIIGATNRPQELDEAARRRLVKRLYIPLPDFDARKQIIQNLMGRERHQLQSTDIDEIATTSEGYSGADMRSLCSEAAMGPIRSLPLSQIVNVKCEQVRAVSMDDFRSALRRVRPSVSQDDLEQYVKWNATFGFDR